MTIFNDDSMGKSPFRFPVHLFLTMLTLTSSIITFFSLADSTGWQRIQALWQKDWMNMWLDNPLCARDYGKHAKSSQFFIGAFPFLCRFSSHCTFKRHYSLARSFWILPPIFLAPLTSTPCLHSVAHYTRLVHSIPNIQFYHNLIQRIKSTLSQRHDFDLLNVPSSHLGSSSRCAKC
jgi:hypothetical protein